jgi:putative hemolysin
MLTSVFLLFTLILANGVLALSEIAVVGSRRARLLQLAERGRWGATDALRLPSDPTRFLSTVQALAF